LPLPRNESRFFGLPVRNLITTLAELFLVQMLQIIRLIVLI